MNICFLCGGFSQFGGIERVTSIVANALAEKEIHNIYTLSLADNGQKAYVLSEKVNQSHFFTEKCSMKRALLKGILGKTVRYIKENKIDVLIACGVMYFPVACLAAKRTGIQSVCWEHTSPTSKNEIVFEKQSRTLGAKLSSANVLISEAMLHFYQNKYKNGNNCLIHNPADPKLFTDPQPYNPQSRKLITVGRLTYQKNYPMLLEVAQRLLEKTDDWTWDIFGDGREYDELLQSIEEKGLTGKVILQGNVSDLYDRYPQYGGIVMTSRWEGFPMVLIEAAAKGLPMISFDVPTGPNEIIEDGVNGYLIPAGERDQMVEKIRTFLENPDMRKQMSAKSRETSGKFTLENTVCDWIALFEQLEKTKK